MKKQIAIAMGLAVLSSSAIASKARLEALGEDANGSQFISDNRNVFLNAATLNEHKDFVTFEWGAESVTADAAATPNAEGGVFKSVGNMVYGAYFGSSRDVTNSLRAAAGANVAEQNVLDLFIAGDAGVQWGANLTYSAYDQDSTDTKSSGMRLNGGVVAGDLSAFAQVGLTNKAEVGANEFEGKSSFDLGVTYNLSDMYYMARIDMANAENAAGNEFTKQNLHVGAAKAYRLNDRANLWMSAWYKMDKMEDKDAGFAGIADGETKDNYLPVSIATEIMVKEWLTLRGSVGHIVFGTNEVENGDKTTKTDTVVNAGATLHFGDFQVDGLVGNIDTGATGDNTVGGSDTSTGQGVLRTDALMSRVSLTYKF